MAVLGHNGGPRIEDEIGYADRDGFITVGRSLRSHPIVGFGVKGPYVPAEAWLDLIMECKYREGRVINGGHLMTIKPGQLIGAVSWLAARWGWTPKQVRVFLDKLEAEGMITKGYPGAENSDFGATPENSGNQNGKHKGKQSHFLTICNYAIYQFVADKKGQTEGQTEWQTEGNHGANKGQQYKEEQGNKGIKEKEEKEGVEAADAASVADATPRPIEALKAFQSYNDLAQRIGIPMARTLTPGRRKSLCARLREHGIESWETALANIEKSAFLRGNNNRNWRADFDFVIRAASYAKLVDGVYGNGAHGDTMKPAETQAERMSRVMRELEQEGRL